MRVQQALGVRWVDQGRRGAIQQSVRQGRRYLGRGESGVHWTGGEECNGTGGRNVIGQVGGM